MTGKVLHDKFLQNFNALVGIVDLKSEFENLVSESNVVMSEMSKG